MGKREEYKEERVRAQRGRGESTGEIGLEHKGGRGRSTRGRGLDAYEGRTRVDLLDVETENGPEWDVWEEVWVLLSFFVLLKAEGRSL